MARPFWRGQLRLALVTCPINLTPATTELTCTWTGTEVFFFGGMNNVGDTLGPLGLYDPARDSWRPIQAVGAPLPRFQHSAVFTDREVIVWGGRSDTAGTVRGNCAHALMGCEGLIAGDVLLLLVDLLAAGLVRRFDEWRARLGVLAGMN